MTSWAEEIDASDGKGFLIAQRRIAALQSRQSEAAREDRAPDAECELHLPKLELESRHLEHLTDGVRTLTGVTTVVLDHNKLTASEGLAKFIAALPETRRLRLVGNRLTSTADFAAALRPLRHLRHLDLDDNKLLANAHFGDALKHLFSLEHLSLCGNHLGSTPGFADALRPLRRLTFLSLQANRLSSNQYLADGLRSLTRLTELMLMQNRLTSTSELARALAPLTQLEHVWLSYNKLTATSQLYRAIAPLRNARTLTLSDNPLKDVVDPRFTPGSLQDFLTGHRRLQPEFKLAIVGRSCTGKTQLRRRLMGGTAVQGEPETQGFQWQRLPVKYAPPWPPDEPEPMLPKGDPQGILLGRPNSVVHVFDFAGAAALDATHRFLLSSRRTIFIVCASRTQTLEESGLERWLKDIRHLHEQDCQAESRRLRREREQLRAGPARRMGDQDSLDHAQRTERRPPVIVVLTGSRRKLQYLDLSKARDLCERHGAELVEDFDSFDDPDGARLRLVRQKITAAAHHVSLRPVWTELWHKDLVKYWTGIRRELGFGSKDLGHRIKRRSFTLDQLYAELVHKIQYRRIRTHAEPEEIWSGAVEYLRKLRELGLVCSRENHNEESGDGLQSIIFSLAAVREPIWRTLRSSRPEAGPLPWADLAAELRKPSSLGPNARLAREEEQPLIELMVQAELMFEAENRATGERLYLVPDRLARAEDSPAGQDAFTNPMETLLKTDLDYVPATVLPRLLGFCWTRYSCEAMTRTSFTVQWRVKDQTVPVRVLADQASGSLYVGIAGGGAVVELIKSLLEDKLNEIMRGSPQRVRLQPAIRDVGTETSALSEADKDKLHRLLDAAERAFTRPHRGRSGSDGIAVSAWLRAAGMAYQRMPPAVKERLISALVNGGYVRPIPFGAKYKYVITPEGREEWKRRRLAGQAAHTNRAPKN